jgi:hypothetical protein
MVYRAGTRVLQYAQRPRRTIQDRIGMMCRKCNWCLHTGQKERAGRLTERGVSVVGIPSRTGSYLPIGRRYAHSPRKLPVQAPNIKHHVAMKMISSISYLLCGDRAKSTIPQIGNRV